MMIGSFFSEVLQNESKRVNEFYYHTFISKYDNKVFLTRRAYVLYKLFSREYKRENGDFSVYGEIYNTHSIPILLKKVNSKKESVLIIDDIIINGRTVKNAYKKLKDKFKSVDIWSIYCNMGAAYFNEIKENVTHTEFVTVDVWERLSNQLTQLIIGSNVGYLSFVNSYNISDHKNFNLKELNVISKKGFFTPTSQIMADNFINSEFLFFELQSNISDSKSLMSVIRYYKKGNSITLIPYVFIQPYSLENCYILCLKLLKAYNIKVSRDVEKYKDNEDGLVLIYKYTIYELSQYIMNEFFPDAKEEFVCKESFKELLDLEGYCDPADLINKEIEKLDIINDSNNGSVQSSKEEELCINLFEECFREGLKKVSQKDLLSFSLETYLSKVKKIDDKRATEKQERICGIKHSSIMKILNKYSLFNNNDEKVLSEEVMCWDSGKASYVVNIEGGKIGCYIRNGEQAFRSIYDVYPVEYNILLEFFDRTRELKKENLMKLGHYLDCQVDDIRFVEFLNSAYYTKEQLFDDILANDMFKLNKKDELKYMKALYLLDKYISKF